jgi:hypothetical protein
MLLIIARLRVFAWGFNDGPSTTKAVFQLMRGDEMPLVLRHLAFASDKASRGQHRSESYT